MAICPTAERIQEFTFYDTFVIKPGKESFNSHTFFVDPVSSSRSFLETNVRTYGGLLVDQKFLNFPLSWDVGAFARSCTFSFQVGQRPYFECPCRDLLIDESKARLRCPPDLLVENGFAMTPVIRVEKSPLILDPEGAGLVGRLLVTGDFYRPVC